MTLVKGENTYLTVAEYREIEAVDFIVTDNVVITDAELENLLYNATSVFDNSFNFKYIKVDENQKLEFPRVDEDGTIYGINYDIEIVTARIAYYLKTDINMFMKKDGDTAQQVKKEKMDIFETEYFELKGDQTISFYDKLDFHSQSLIDRYIVAEGGSNLGIFKYRTNI